MIDPNLEAPGNQNAAGTADHEGSGEMLAGTRDHAKPNNENIHETDTKLAYALKGFSDGQG